MFCFTFVAFMSKHCLHCSCLPGDVGSAIFFFFLTTTQNYLEESISWMKEGNLIIRNWRLFNTFNFTKLC